MNTRALLLPLVFVMTLSVVAFDKLAAEATTQRKSNMKINLKLPDKTLTATLCDTPTARDFASLLPLTLEDYSKTEKTATCPGN